MCTTDSATSKGLLQLISRCQAPLREITWPRLNAVGKLVADMHLHTQIAIPLADDVPNGLTLKVGQVRW